MKRQKNGIWKLTDDDMNFLSLALNHASKELSRDGAPAIAREMRKLDEEIYNTLKEAGFYEGLGLEAETA